MTIITVSQLNNYIKRYIDNNDLLHQLWIKGEISNYKRHSSGHIYMTLKDNASSVKCVMFYSDAQSLKFNPENGMSVIAFGRISVYERDGLYQLYINELIPDGKGQLYAAFEQLKKQLSDLGYFDESIKKRIPEYPSKIGIVTAPGSAALQDIINITKRRYPIAEIYVYPAQVQGIGAENTISAGINYFNSRLKTDVIICGRGGGSIEDLWAFNERIVADAIYKSDIPVISAVGHETDYTISDFAADLRAPTPSAAAELAVPDINQIKITLKNSSSRCKSALIAHIRQKQGILDNLMSKNIHKLLNNHICNLRIYNDDTFDRLKSAYSNMLKQYKNTLSAYCINLDALSPLKVLSRGYSVVKQDTKVIKSINDINIGDEINVILSDGEFKAQIKEI